MASFLEGMETVEADNSMRSNIEEWRRTLVGMLRRAGVSQERITFFFADSFIQANNAVHQQMLEDVCNLVTHGIIPNLFSADELVDMHEQLLAPAKRAGGRWADSKASLLEFFMHSCNHNLRIVVSVTSVTSDTVRSRLLACPALTQACCMMWLQPWGDEGLKAIAERFVADIPMEPQLKQSVVLCCVRIHILAQKVSQESSAKTGISTMVPAEQFLELLKTFRHLLDQNRGNQARLLRRYLGALERLNDVNEAIVNIREEINLLKPELSQSSDQSDQLTHDIEDHNRSVKELSEAIAVLEHSTEQYKLQVTQLKEEISGQLGKLITAVDAALQGVQALKKPALDDLKQIKVVTAGISLTVAALCIIFGVEPKKQAGPAAGKDDNYWEPGKKKLLEDPKFFKRVLEFDKDTINDEMSAKLKPLVTHANFDSAKIGSASAAGGVLAKWLQALQKYDWARRELKKQQEQLVMAEASLDVDSAELKKKQEHLDLVKKELSEMQNEHDTVGERKKGMEEQTQLLAERLLRAEKLTDAFSNEKEAWVTKADGWRQTQNNLVGNSLVAAVYVAYLGQLTQPFRDVLLKSLLEQFEASKPVIPCQRNIKLSALAGDLVELSEWTLVHKLLPDSVSSDNACIWKLSRRWPLFIDPQDLALKWVRAFEDDLASIKDAMDKERGIEKKKGNPTGIQVLKAGYTDLEEADQQAVKQTLVYAMEHGLPVLVEGVIDAIDPIFEPLLNLRPASKRPMNSMVKIAEGLTAIPQLKVRVKASSEAKSVERPSTGLTALLETETVEVIHTDGDGKGEFQLDSDRHVFFAGELRPCHEEFRMYFFAKNAEQLQVYTNAFTLICCSEPLSKVLLL